MKLFFAAAVLFVGGVASLAVVKLSDGNRRTAALTISERTIPSRTVEAPTVSAPLRSANGEYEVNVTDKGIVWRGPTGSINLTVGGVTLKSSPPLRIQGSGLISVQGTTVRLCGSGGSPIARVGDLTQATVVPTPPAGLPGTPVAGPITQGSPTVLAC